MTGFFRVASILGAAALLACGGDETKMAADLAKDLELASANEGIALAGPAVNASQVVSAVERTAPPAPRRLASIERAPRHRPRSRPSPPEPVEAEAGEIVEEIEEQAIADAPVATAPEPPVAPRPRPADVVYPTGRGGGIGDIGAGTGIGIGTAVGVIGVVLRGGAGGIDECDPRYDGRMGGRGRIPVSIGSQIPVIRGTFPARPRF